MMDDPEIRSAGREMPEDELTEIIDEIVVDPSARYVIIDANTFGLAKSTTPVLTPGIYRGKYINYDWQLAKDKVVSDKIIITSEISQKIIKQIQDFWNIEEDFKNNGLLHKRGFMLTGKAGCGKSSIINAVITDAIKNKCIVFLPDPRESGADFLSCMKKIKSVEPNKKVLVVLEDFESFLDGHPTSITRWLNILDGADGFNNIVYLATSNYPEQIDTRFTNRPSRFDTVYIIDAPSYDDRLSYIKHRKMNIDDILARDIAKDTEGLSYAHIKELLVSVYLLKLDYKNTLERMANQSEHPISSKDFDGKKQKIGFHIDIEKEIGK